MPKHAWHAAIRYEFVQGARRQGSQGGISPPMTSVGPRAKVGLSLDLGPRPGQKVPGQKKDHATKNPQLRFESSKFFQLLGSLKFKTPAPNISVLATYLNNIWICGGLYFISCCCMFLAMGSTPDFCWQLFWLQSPLGSEQGPSCCSLGLCSTENRKICLVMHCTIQQHQPQKRFPLLEVLVAFSVASSLNIITKHKSETIKAF